MPPFARVRVTIVEGRNLPDCDLRKPDASAIMSVFMKPNPATTFATDVDFGTYAPQWHFSSELEIEEENDAIQFELFMKPPTSSVTSALQAQGILPKDTSGKPPPPLTQNNVAAASKAAAKAAIASKKATGSTVTLANNKEHMSESARTVDSSLGPPQPGRISYANNGYTSGAGPNVRSSTAEWDGIVSVPDWLLGRTVVPVACAVGVPFYDNWHRLADCRKGGPELRVRIEVLKEDTPALPLRDDQQEGVLPKESSEQPCADRGAGPIKRSDTRSHLDEADAIPSNEGCLVAGQSDEAAPFQSIPPLAPLPAGRPPNNVNATTEAATQHKPASHTGSTPNAITPGWYFIRNCHNTYMCLAPYHVMQTVTMSEWCRIYIDTAYEPSREETPNPSSSQGFREHSANNFSAKNHEQKNASQTAIFASGSGHQSPASGTSRANFGNNSSIAAESLPNNSASKSLKTSSSQNFISAVGSNVLTLARKIPIVGGGAGSGPPAASSSVHGPSAGFDPTGGAKRDGILYTLRSSADRGLLEAAQDRSKHVKKDALQILKMLGGKVSSTNSVDKQKDSEASVTHNFATLQKVSRGHSAMSKKSEWHMNITDKEPASNPLSLFEIVPHPRHHGKHLIHSTVAGVNLVAEPGGWGAGYNSIMKPSDWATFELIRATTSPLKAPHIAPGSYLIQSCFGTYLCGLKKKITHRRGNDDGVKVTLAVEAREGEYSEIEGQTPVYSLKTVFGNYVCFENGRCEASKQPFAWEKFEVQPHPTLPDRYTIYSCAFKTYLSCRTSESLTKIRNSDVIGDREGFGFIRVDAPGSF